MIENCRSIAVVLALGGGCDLEPKDPHAGAWQGVVEFEERVLAFEVPGRVRSIGVEEGDTVAPGDTIAQLDDRLEQLSKEARAAEARAVRADLDLVEAGSRPEDIRSLKASRASAKATEALAEQTATRMRRLRSQGIASAAELDEAEANLATASARRRELEAQLQRLRHGARSQEVEAAEARAQAAETAVALADERIARHTLRADGPGLVLDVHLEPGEFAQIGTPVTTLADVTRPYVDVFVPQGQIGLVSLGQAVAVEVDARAEPYAGTVEFISSETEFTPRFLFSERERPNLVIRVRVRVDAPQGSLHAGLPAFVTPKGSAS